MKTLKLSILCIFVFISGSLFAQIYDFCPDCGHKSIKGDLNKDHFTNIADVAYLVNLLLGKENQESFGNSIAVDLGLPSKTLWYNKNLGSVLTGDVGSYYSWGNTHPQTYYTSQAYPFYSNYGKNVDKYGSDGLTKLEKEDDIANIALGSQWFIPTKTQCEELIEYCEFESSALYDGLGVKIIGPNNNYIFIPWSGYKYDDTTITGRELYVWTNSLDTDAYKFTSAWVLHITSSNLGVITAKVESTDRIIGCNIRPVNTYK